MSWYDAEKSIGAVTFFTNHDCYDDSWAFYANGDDDYYSLYDFSNHFPDNQMKSFYLPKDYTLTIYSEDHLGGESKVYEG